MSTEYLLALALLIACCAYALAAPFWALRRVHRQLEFPEDRSKKQLLRVGLVAIGWLLLTGVLAGIGFYKDFTGMPPRFFANIVVPLALVLWVTFSKGLRELLPHVPPQWLVYAQAFRIPVEIFLWLLFLDGVAPVQMSYEGLNMDVFSGILALPAGWWIAKRKRGWRKVLFAYNVVGMLLLLNILVIAVLSAPLPIRVFMNEPANTFVTGLPWVYLPALLVVMAYTLHIFSWRWLWVTRNRAQV